MEDAVQGGIFKFEFECKGRAFFHGKLAISRKRWELRDRNRAKVATWYIIRNRIFPFRWDENRRSWMILKVSICSRNCIGCSVSFLATAGLSCSVAFWCLPRQNYIYRGRAAIYYGNIYRPIRSAHKLYAYAVTNISAMHFVALSFSVIRGKPSQTVYYVLSRRRVCSAINRFFTNEHHLFSSILVYVQETAFYASNRGYFCAVAVNRTVCLALTFENYAVGAW